MLQAMYWRGCRHQLALVSEQLHTRPASCAGWSASLRRCRLTIPGLCCGTSVARCGLPLARDRDHENADASGSAHWTREAAARLAG